MIYACLRFIEEWAQPLTVVNFIAARARVRVSFSPARSPRSPTPRVPRRERPAALVVTLDRLARRACRPCAATPRIRHRSTLQSARPAFARPRLVQTSMGMSAGSFNTREFFHRASAAGMRRVRLALIVLASPAGARSAARPGTSAAPPWIVAALLQAPGLFADRWYLLRPGKAPAEPVLPGRLVALHRGFLLVSSSRRRPVHDLCRDGASPARTRSTGYFGAVIRTFFLLVPSPFETGVARMTELLPSLRRRRTFSPAVPAPWPAPA